MGQFMRIRKIEYTTEQDEQDGIGGLVQWAVEYMDDEMEYYQQVFGIHKQYPRPNHYGPPERIVLYPCGEQMENWRWGCIERSPDSPKMVARSNSIFDSIDDAFDDAERYAMKIPVGSEIIAPSLPLPEKEA